MAQRHSMDEEDRPDNDSEDQSLVEGSSSGVILAIIVIAVFLAIAAMLMFPDRGRGYESEAAMRAVPSAGHGMIALGHAAVQSGETIRNAG